MKRQLLFALVLLLALWLPARAQVNVGLGTTAPTQAFDVNGTLRVRGLSGTDSRLPQVQSDGTLGLSAPAYSQAPAAFGLSLVGTENTGDEPVAVAANDSLAYVVCNNSNSLEVVNIRPANGPVTSHLVPAGSQPVSVALSGIRACVVSIGDHRLRVFDVSQAQPVLLGTYDTGAGSLPVRVAMRGTYAYVLTAFSDQLLVFDVALPLPGPPVLLASLPVAANPRDVAVSGSLAVVISSNAASTLQTFDVSNPAAPLALGSISVETYPTAVALQGSLASVASGTGNLQVFDLTTPSSPILQAAVPTGPNPKALTLSDNLAYVVGNGNQLRVFDLGTRTAPVLLGTGTVAANPYGVALTNRLACVVSGNPSNTLQCYHLEVPRRLGLNADGSLGVMPPAALSLNGLILSIGGGSPVTLPGGDNLGSGVATTALRLPEREMYLRPGTDDSHGLGYYGLGADARSWAGQDVQGPVLHGFEGGALGSRQGNTASTALRWNGTGYVGLGLGLLPTPAEPAVGLDVGGALALRPTSLALTTDNQAVPVGNTSYLRLSSNAGTGTSRTVLLGAGTQAGQVLVLENVDSAGSFELRDDPATGTNLASHHIFSGPDALRLVWNGSLWLEVSYQDN